MLKIHHLNDSRSQRILWLLEELELNYEIIKYQRDKVTMLAPKELENIHPLGKSPVLEDGDLVVAESGAIVEYLLKKYGKGSLTYPEDLEQSVDHSYWLHFAEGTLMPPFLLKLVFDKINSSVPFFMKPLTKAISSQVMKSFVGPNIKRNLSFINNRLEDRVFLLGDDVTGADIMMSFPLEAGLSRIEDQDSYIHIRKYIDTIHARSAYKRALDRGGEYSYK